MPLVLAIVFIVMNAMSLDLHRITLGALIIALGLLVDDTIIAVLRQPGASRSLKELLQSGD